MGPEMRQRATTAAPSQEEPPPPPSAPLAPPAVSRAPGVAVRIGGAMGDTSLYTSPLFCATAGVFLVVFCLFAPLNVEELRPSFYPFRGEDQELCKQSVDTLKQFSAKRVIVPLIGFTGAGKTTLAEEFEWLCSGIPAPCSTKVTKAPESQTKTVRNVPLSSKCRNIELIDMRGMEEDMSDFLKQDFMRMYHLAIEGRLAPGSTVENIVELPRPWFGLSYQPKTAVAPVLVHDSGVGLSAGVIDFVKGLVSQTAENVQIVVALTQSGKGSISDYLRKYGDFKDLGAMANYYNEHSIKQAFNLRGVSPQWSFVHKGPCFASNGPYLVPGMAEEFASKQLCLILNTAADWAKKESIGLGGAKSSFDHFVLSLKNFQAWLFSSIIGWCVVRALVVLALGPVCKAAERAYRCLSTVRVSVGPSSQPSERPASSLPTGSPRQSYVRTDPSNLPAIVEVDGSSSD